VCAYSGVRVDGASVDVEVLLGKHLGSLVDSASGTIEDTTQHVLGHTELQALSGELDLGLLDIDTGGALEHLNDSSVA